MDRKPGCIYGDHVTCLMCLLLRLLLLSLLRQNRPAAIVAKGSLPKHASSSRPHHANNYFARRNQRRWKSGHPAQVRRGDSPLAMSCRSFVLRPGEGGNVRIWRGVSRSGRLDVCGFVAPLGWGTLVALRGGHVVYLQVSYCSAGWIIFVHFLVFFFCFFQSSSMAVRRLWVKSCF